MSARYSDDKLYRFHWRGTGGPQDGYGRDVADAFNRLGYSAGALAALDYYEELPASVAQAPEVPS